MVNVLFCGYRSWALDVYHALSNDMINLNAPITFTLAASRDIFNSILESDPEYKRYDIYLFVGWSWFVPVSLVAQKCCLCIHPSPFPKYRGGSPIQNQVLNGEMASSVTLFKMNDKLDAGPIFKQESILLGGPIREIFAKIEYASVLLLRDFFVRYCWAPESIIWIAQDEGRWP